jgi:ABC-2 type transport system permease protein
MRMGFYSIYKKELRLYFGSATAYVVMLIFQALSGIFFYTELVQFSLFLGQDLNLGLWRFVFHDVRWVLFLVIPLLTMRLFAEEKKLGTLELLWTYPVKDLSIILGKYFAAVTVLILMLILTLIYPVLILPFHTIDPGPIMANYLGLLLLGAAFLACGIFVSSLTDSQLIAGVVTYGLFFLFWMLTWNEAAFSETLGQILLRLSLFDRFDDFARGVIDSKNIIYLFLFTVFFLFLTYCSLDSRRWKGLRA